VIGGTVGGTSLSVENELRRHEEKIKKNKEFLMNERNIEINRSNQALLNKLVEISTGKWSSVPHVLRHDRS
jgi:Hemingway/CFA97